MALFLGCAGDAFFPQTTLNTARVLQRNGCEVWVPRTQNCCGALHYHSAHEEPARQFAQQNCEAFGLTKVASEVDAIITNAAGCGFQLKDYAHMMHGTPHAEVAARFQSKVRDVSEFLMELGPVKPKHELKVRATYHDACHFRRELGLTQCALGLLSRVEGLEVRRLGHEEECCGFGGTFSIKLPEVSGGMLKAKLEDIRGTGAGVAVAADFSCLAHIEAGARGTGQALETWTMAELLARALG